MGIRCVCNLLNPSENTCRGCLENKKKINSCDLSVNTSKMCKSFVKKGLLEKEYKTIAKDIKFEVFV